MMDGLLRNLDTEITGIGPRLSAARLEHGPQGDHFCSAGNVAFRLFTRVTEDPADAGDALTAAAQCRESYRGAVSLPVSEELESLRNLCEIAHDRIVEHHDNPEIVFEPDRAAIYAIGRCADYRGVAQVAYALTGSGWGVWHEANGIVRTLTNSFLRGEFSEP